MRRRTRAGQRTQPDPTSAAPDTSVPSDPPWPDGSRSPAASAPADPAWPDGSRSPAASAPADQPASVELPVERRRSGVRDAVRLFTALDLIALAFLIAGGVVVATGVLPVDAAGATVRRILPLLVFLGSVIVLAELTARAEVFDVIATRLAIIAGGRFWLLFVLCVLFATVTTAALNLDTTAVLLTPVMLATAARIDAPRMPLAMTTVWLANTASLLLPVSNLTNLLAGNRVALEAPAFARQMLLPELASVGATMLCLWLFYWRRSRRHAERYRPPAAHRAGDRALFTVASSACALFVVGVLAGAPLAVMSLAAAALVVLTFLIRRPGALANWRLLPLQLLAFVTGLFLVFDAIDRAGLGRALRGLVGDDGGAAGVLRAAGVGAALSNAINNLPAYVAVEHAIAPEHHEQLFGLIIGTNVGPIITPWASLATLIWYGRCRAHGVKISWRRFILTGSVTAVVTLLAATGALLISG